MLDLDATDIPLYGHQPERFFHGYYDSYCYLPLYIFAGDQLLCARLRPSNVDGAAGALDEVKRIVAKLRMQWPKVRIVLRADSGFCREELMAWCEAQQNQVDFLFGLARNQRLQKIIGRQMHQAKLLHADHRQSCARLYRVRLPDAQELGQTAARRSQGRISGQGGEPALRRYLAGRRQVGRARTV